MTYKPKIQKKPKIRTNIFSLSVLKINNNKVGKGLNKIPNKIIPETLRIINISFNKYYIE